MKCPNCSNLMLKGKLAESCWECGTCKGRYFIIQTSPSLLKIEEIEEIRKNKWYRIVMTQYEELRRLGFNVPPGFIDFSLAFAFLKEDGVIEDENDKM